jgi:hypothetical protein
MPLTTKGEKIKKNMEKEYGKEKGEEVFYASQNKGTIKGTHKEGAHMDKFAEGFMGRMAAHGVPEDRAVLLLKVAVAAQSMEESPAFAAGFNAVTEKQAIINPILKRLLVGGGVVGAGTAGGIGLSKLFRKEPTMVERLQSTWKGMPTWGKRLAIGVPAAAGLGLGAYGLHKLLKKKPAKQDEEESVE